MKLRTCDVLNMIESGYGDLEGKYEYWIEFIWEIAKKYDIDAFDTWTDKIRAYSFIYGACMIYALFTKMLNGDDADEEYIYISLKINYSKLTSGNPYFTDKEELITLDEDGNECENWEYIEEFIKCVIFSPENKESVFRLLDKEVGISYTFAALYYCIYYTKFSVSEYESDEDYYGEDSWYSEDEIENYEMRKRFSACKDNADFNEILDMILNVVDMYKLRAYEWLSYYMD